MPYIQPEYRERAASDPENAGELNYAITVLLVGYIQRKGLNYQIINDVMGAAIGAAQEFYRRVAIPYEDKKIQHNGDVYPYYVNK